MFSWPEVEEFRGRTVLGNLRRFNATVFRRFLAGSAPALERRLIAFPRRNFILEIRSNSSGIAAQRGTAVFHHVATDHRVTLHSQLARLSALSNAAVR